MRMWPAVVALVLGGCIDSSPPSPPDQVLPPQRMVQVLVRLHLAEAQAAMAGTHADTAYNIYQSLQQRTLADLNLDTATLYRSQRWYASHPVLMDQVYAQVVDSLGIYESSLQKP